MEGDCNVYAHSSLWMRPTGEWSINAKMVYKCGYNDFTSKYTDINSLHVTQIDLLHNDTFCST